MGKIVVCVAISTTQSLNINPTNNPPPPIEIYVLLWNGHKTWLMGSKAIILISRTYLTTSMIDITHGLNKD